MQSQKCKVRRELSGIFSERLSCSKQGVDRPSSFLLDVCTVPEVQGQRFQLFPQSSVVLLYIV